MNKNPSASAVVFAYHSVGVQCIKVLLAQHIDIKLVITHEDNNAENIWFDSVASLCKEHELEILVIEKSTSQVLFEKIAAISPDFIFSFYYRNMLPTNLLALAKRGAYNMHGSLLPKYRGRVPINWAVLHGETEAGATLHKMVAKADAGAIVAQTAVPILPDDTAHEVFLKVIVAAEQTLSVALPQLLNNSVNWIENDVSKGSYFKGRKPEDGRIDWTQTAQQVYNLHRAVAPPYPGAFTSIGEHTFVIGKARLLKNKFENLPTGLSVWKDKIVGVCADGYALDILELYSGGKLVTTEDLSNFPKVLRLLN